MLRRLTLLLKSSMIAYLGLTSMCSPKQNRSNSQPLRNAHASLPRKRAMNACTEPNLRVTAAARCRPGHALVIIVAAELLLLPGRLFVECHLTAAVRFPYGEDEKQRRQW